MIPLVVELSDAAIVQGDQTILQEVNLQMQEREFVYLVGKTGSGKSSLLKTLYGDLALARGKGRVAGFDLARLNRRTIPKLRRKLGIVFQDFNLLSDRTVMENLLFVLRATGWKNPHNQEKKMREVLTKVGLQGQAAKMPHQLSGGEQQRLVIARALLNNPALLIADEPTGNLDPDTSLEILQLLKNLGEEWKTAVLLATHDTRLMEAMPARTLRCEAGRLVETAPWPG